MNIEAVIGYIVGVGGAITILYSKVKNDNLKDLQERVKILENERKFAKERHLQNQKAISKLEGQLATYKEIPLRHINESLGKIADSNSEILKTLTGSAEIADKANKDGGLLVKTKPSKVGA